MTKVYEFPRLDRRYDKASEWISKLDKGLSASEREALQQWMSADKENESVLFEMAELWDDMSELTRLSDLFPKGSKRQVKRPRATIAAAATVLIAVIAGVWATVSFNTDSQTLPAPVVASVEASDSVYETAVGEQSTVQLSDGTRIVLNTNSRIEVEYAQKYRLLSLTRGEVHIHVTPDASRPLSVLAGSKIVQAVGTAFGLEITSDRRVELVVTEGKVLVNENQPSRSTPEEGLHEIQRSPTTVAVAAGERFMLDEPEAEIAEVTAEEIAVKLSWRQGNLVFRGESLEDAIAEIERYTTVKFVILDEKLKKVRIAGLFRAGDAEGLLATLHENFDVFYERTSDGRILLSSL